MKLFKGFQIDLFLLIFIVYFLSFSVLSSSLGDAYADSVVEKYSFFYYNGENSIGAPDGEYAIIALGYTIGYLTLDMGEFETIIDGEGDDFSIIAIGNYTVWVGNGTSEPIDMLDIGVDNQSYDISTSEFNEVRYIKIVYGGGANVLLDAIEAFNYNSPENSESPTPSPTGFSTGEFIGISVGGCVIFSRLIHAKSALVKRKKK